LVIVAAIVSPVQIITLLVCTLSSVVFDWIVVGLSSHETVAATLVWQSTLWYGGSHIILSKTPFNAGSSFSGFSKS